MTELLSLAAVLACTLFAGAAIYINLVEHPARLSCGTEIAATEWKPSYQRATWMQAPLAMVAAFAGVGLWVQGSGPLWLWGATLIFSVVPFTLVVIRPTSAWANRIAIADPLRRVNCSRNGDACTPSGPD